MVHVIGSNQPRLAVDAKAIPTGLAEPKGGLTLAQHKCIRRG
jgi:hypothetical protein